MNAAVNALYAEYLDHTGGDKAAAASLTLAAMMAETGGKTPPSTALTVAEAARRLNVTRQTVYQMCQSGRLRSLPARHRPALRIPLEAIEECENQERGQGAGPAIPRHHQALLLVSEPAMPIPSPPPQGRKAARAECPLLTPPTVTKAADAAQVGKLGQAVTPALFNSWPATGTTAQGPRCRGRPGAGGDDTPPGECPSANSPAQGQRAAGRLAARFPRTPVPLAQPPIPDDLSEPPSVLQVVRGPVPGPILGRGVPTSPCQAQPPSPQALFPKQRPPAAPSGAWEPIPNQPPGLRFVTDLPLEPAFRVRPPPEGLHRLGDAEFLLDPLLGLGDAKKEFSRRGDGSGRNSW